MAGKREFRDDDDDKPLVKLGRKKSRLSNPIDETKLKTPLKTPPRKSASGKSSAAKPSARATETPTTVPRVQSKRRVLPNQTTPPPMAASVVTKTYAQKTPTTSKVQKKALDAKQTPKPKETSSARKLLSAKKTPSAKKNPGSKQYDAKRAGSAKKSHIAKRSPSVLRASSARKGHLLRRIEAEEDDGEGEAIGKDEIETESAETNNNEAAESSPDEKTVEEVDKVTESMAVHELKADDQESQSDVDESLDVELSSGGGESSEDVKTGTENTAPSLDENASPKPNGIQAKEAIVEERSTRNSSANTTDTRPQTEKKAIAPKKLTEKSLQDAPAESPQSLSRNLLDSETLCGAIESMLKLYKTYQAEKSKEKTKAMSDIKKAEEDLVEDETNVSLVVGFKMPPKQVRLKPKRILLKHSLYKAGEDDVMLIVKDPQRAVKDYLAEHGNGGVTRVLGLTKLKKRYGTFERRRELARSYDLFLVDSRVAPSMPKLLGNPFIKAKKMPIPINMDRNVAVELERAISSTPFAPAEGTCATVHVARVNFTPEQIAENVQMAAKGIATFSPGGWNGVQSVHIKTQKSTSLPIYMALPEVVTKERNEKELDSSEKKKKKKEPSWMKELFGEKNRKKSKANASGIQKKRKGTQGKKKKA